MYSGKCDKINETNVGPLNHVVYVGALRNIFSLGPFAFVALANFYHGKQSMLM